MGLQGTYRPEAPTAVAGMPANVIGWVTGITVDGQACVDYPGNVGEPVVAESTVSVASDFVTDERLRVVLTFDGDDRRCPIIVGLIQPAFVTFDDATPPGPLSCEVDGKRVDITAQEELTLRCGRGSITLRKNGKIIVKGTDLLSRASRSNRIKGSSVSIN